MKHIYAGTKESDEGIQNKNKIQLFSDHALLSGSKIFHLKH